VGALVKTQGHATSQLQASKYEPETPHLLAIAVAPDKVGINIAEARRQTRYRLKLKISEACPWNSHAEVEHSRVAGIMLLAPFFPEGSR